MKFTAFCQSLIPSFQKDSVIEDIRMTRSELDNSTIPAYKASLEVFKKWDFKSEKLQNFESTFKKNTKGSKSVVESIYDGLITLDENLELVNKLITKTFNSEISGAGLSYLKANLIQFAEYGAFVSKYARKLLLYIYVFESAQFDKNGLDSNDSIPPAEVKYIEENMFNFIQAFACVTNDHHKTVKSFEDIPDIVITGDNEDTLASTQSKSIDPFSMRFIPTWVNPIYHIRMHIAEWQVNRYKASQEELKSIQLRKLHLERLKAGKNDAALEKEINYLDSRIQSLNYKIKQFEEE